VTEDIETSARQPVEDTVPTAAGEQPASDGGSAAGGASAAVGSMQQRAVAIADQRPEVAAGAAFAGGFLLALILKRIVR
jgi:hypothetical protein